MKKTINFIKANLVKIIASAVLFILGVHWGGMGFLFAIPISEMWR